MEAISVVLYQKDPGTAQLLASGLSQRFASVRLARSYEEICPEVARHRAEAVVLDLEGLSPSALQRLHREFPSLCIVGTHRLADDELWTEALNKGAADICEPRQDEVVRALLHVLARPAAA